MMGLPPLLHNWTISPNASRFDFLPILLTNYKLLVMMCSYLVPNLDGLFCYTKDL